MRRCFGLLAAFGRARDGVAAVEFGLLAPMLLLIVAASLDLGLAYSAQIKVQQAAQAGAQYALLHGFDSTKITTAVTSATSLSVNATPAPTQQCGCLTGSTVTLSGTPPCLVTCGNGVTPGTYVQVNAQASYTPLIPYATLLSSPTTLSSQAQVRIQ
ncbi:MAG TPA: TadE/TadG family type IV pilus assembly protein [Stellaceae bacterium]|nr:TadE/TadG family type IV pilus assembly protein [Stellaceae bacterium]